MSETSLSRARLAGLRDRTGAVLKSAGHCLGACLLIAMFACGAYSALCEVRLPDAELLQRAVEKAQAAASVQPSALAERDAALMMLAASVAFVAGGVWLLVEWWRSLPFVRKAAK